jgi:hypothetical protein
VRADRSWTQNLLKSRGRFSSRFDAALLNTIARKYALAFNDEFSPYLHPPASADHFMRTFLTSKEIQPLTPDDLSIDKSREKSQLTSDNLQETLRRSFCSTFHSSSAEVK